jgi:hypothetical protein
MTQCRKAQRGQAIVEWLLLISVISLIAFTVVFVALGPRVTAGIEFLRGGLRNAIRNADVTFGPDVEPNNGQHPGSARRARRLH